MLRATACREKRELGKRAEGAQRTHVDKALVHAPPVDDTPLDLVPPLLSLALAQVDTLLPHLVQTAAGRRAAVLRVLRERDRPLDAVALHLLEARLGQRVGVAEGDVCLVRCSLGRELVEKLGHPFALHSGPAENGRTTANRLVLLLNLGRSSLGDERRDGRLEGEGDQVCAVGR